MTFSKGVSWIPAPAVPMDDIQARSTCPMAASAPPFGCDSRAFGSGEMNASGAMSGGGLSGFMHEAVALRGPHAEAGEVERDHAVDAGIGGHVGSGQILIRLNGAESAARIVLTKQGSGGGVLQRVVERPAESVAGGEQKCRRGRAIVRAEDREQIRFRGIRRGEVLAGEGFAGTVGDSLQQVAAGEGFNQEVGTEARGRVVDVARCPER